MCMQTDRHKSEVDRERIGVYFKDVGQRFNFLCRQIYIGWCMPLFFLLKAQPHQKLDATNKKAMLKENLNENKLPVRLILDLRALNKRILRKSAASWPQESCRNIVGQF